MKYAFITITTALILFACNSETRQNQQTEESGSESSQESGQEESNNNEEATEIAVDEVVAEINSYRQGIEENKEALELKEASTEGMREQIRQKWQTIHFYFDGEELVRVKSYPYAEISKRTEVFYFRDGKLLSAHILDRGMDESIDAYATAKSYFFYNDNLIHEENNSGEAEFSIRDSDGERLLQEAMEYLEISAGV